jgi:hypothetical protein
METHLAKFSLHAVERSLIDQPMDRALATGVASSSHLF